MSAASELIRDLKKDRKNPELLRKTAQLLVSQPEMFVSNVLAHALLEERKLARFLKIFCMSRRAKWQNYCATQKCNPREVLYPHTLADLKAILAKAADLNCS